MGGTVFPGAVRGGFREIGQFEHLDAFGKPMNFLKSKGHYKGEARVINFFLNPPWDADPVYLDPVFIGFYVNKKEVIKDNYQYCRDRQVF